MRVFDNVRPRELLCLSGIILLSWSTRVAGQGTPDDLLDPAVGQGQVEAVLDSLRSDTDPLFENWEMLAEPIGWAGPDTTDWIPDPESNPFVGRPAWKSARTWWNPRMDFSKVDGYSAGLGAGARWLRRPGLRLDGSYDRAFGRGAYQGDVRISLQSRSRDGHAYSPASETRMTGGGKEGMNAFNESRFRHKFRWAIQVGYRERTTVYGSNRPYGNATQALLFSLDHQEYLYREERSAGFQIHPTSAIRSEAVFVQRRDRSMHSVRDPLWNTDPRLWSNQPVDRVTTQGVIARLTWAGGADFLAQNSGIALRGSAFGGSLGKDVEYYTVGLEARRRFAAPGSESLDLELWGGLVGGRDAPIQEMADLGGESSLRGYPHRSFVGSSMALLRADYLIRFDPFRVMRIPLLKNLRIQPVLFADIGAVWGETSEDGRATGWTSVEEITGPESSDWRSDVGLGLQRYLGFPGLLDKIRADFAWRTDRNHDRFRFTFAFSR